MLRDEEKKEYLVQVTIVEARHLKGKNNEGMSNPFVKIQCIDLVPQATNILYSTLTPIWNQSFTFSNVYLSKADLQKGELTIEVWSKNNFFSNSLIGTYAIGLYTLYKNANHEFYNCWLTLTSPEFETEAQGYLLVHCFIIGSGDKPPIHSINDKINNDEEEDDEELNLDNMNIEQLKAYQEKKQGITVLGKPNVIRKSYQLSVYIFKAENLVNMENQLFGGGKTDPFISCRAIGLVQKTKTVKNNNNPLYNQKILFPCYFPVLNEKIILRMWHSNIQDDFIADIPEKPEPNDYFNINKLIVIGGRMPAKWINLYSIPPSERNVGFITNFVKKKHPREGTYYMGRVLLSLSLLPKEKPLFSITNCNPFYEPETAGYKLFFDIYELKYLKYFDIKVWVEVSIGRYTTGKSKKKRPNRFNICMWKKDEAKKINEVCLPAIQEHFPKDLTQIPDIFINLYTGLTQEERIGYIRLKAEDVFKWPPIPRWLHLNPIDLNKESPGSILCNMQFVLDNEHTKRIFKQKGVCTHFILYAHVVSGFELDPTNSDDELESRIEVELCEKTANTKVQRGRFPYWNELLDLNVELDWKLDFAPDVAVTLYQTNKKGFLGRLKETEIGKFTVPVRSIQENKKYPHFFNLIKNNDKVGRILAMFYIETYDPKAKKKFFPVYENLKKNVNKAKLEIVILGGRNLDFSGYLKDFELKVELIQNGENEIKHNQIKSELDINDINHESGKTNKIINVCQRQEFLANIYGDEDFQIFPYLKITLKKRAFFGDDERFILFNLADFLDSYNENKKKLYRMIFEQNIDERKMDQEQYILKEFEDNLNVINQSLDESEIVLKNTEENLETAVGEEEEDLCEIKINLRNVSEKKKNKPKLEIRENLDEEAEIHKREIELLEVLMNYKNMSVSNTFEVSCSHKDKVTEKEMKKKLRLKLKKKLRCLKAKDSNNENEVKKIAELEHVVRELSKPLINEEIFFGFDDLSEEYDYGREIFKEDVYEFHPDLVIPYKKHQLCYIPGIFEHKCEDMGGYMRRGKVTDNIIKLAVKMTILEEEQKIQEETDVETQILLKKPKKLNSLINCEDMYDIEIDHELKKLDIFDKDFFQYLSNCYFNKSVRKGKPKDEFAIPFDKIKVRVYIYRCLNLSAQDDAADYFVKMAGMSALSKANSYLEIIVGEDIASSNSKQIKYINDRNNFIPNTLNPDFFKYFELEAELPQDWKLTINVMSKNNTGSDSLIGSTIIDLEDRYLGEYRTRELLKLKSLEKKYFQELEKIEEENENNLKEHKFLIADIKARLNSIHKKMDEIKESQIPVEYRPLLHPYKKTAQGIVEMFVEVLPVARAKHIKPSKIEPPMPENYELRLVIWETKNVYLEGKKSIDVFIKVNYNPEGWLGEPVMKQTDVHLGCEDGRAVFNYRLKFNLKLPCSFPRLYFTVYDFNTISNDQSLGECYISLRRVLKRLLKEGKLSLENKWIPLTHPKDPGENKGEVKISIYLIQQDEADQKPVGEGQNDPNKDPYLEKPNVGRGIKDFVKDTVLDPSGWKMSFDFVGNLKILLIVGAIILIFVLLFISPGWLR